MGGINHSLGKVYPMSELANTPGSPFDALEGVDGRWSARELMEPLGYDTWRRLSDAVDRAKVSAANQGMDTDDAFMQVTEYASAGNLGQKERQDYHLSPRLVRG